MTELVDERPALLTAPGPILFSGTETVAGEITATIVGTGPRWADDVLRSLAPGERAICAIPFAPGHPAIAHRLSRVVDDPVEIAHALERRRRAARQGPRHPLRWAEGATRPPGRHTVVERPSRAVYAERVRAALADIDAGRVEKVVLGRGLDIVSSPPLAPEEIAARLLAARSGRYVFAVPLSTDPTGPTLLGSSPELLVGRRGRTVTSLPLAGSAPRAADPVEDGRRTARLLDSDKDLAEHAHVVQQVRSVLATVCDDLQVDRRPRLVSTDTIHHLGTMVRGSLAPDEQGRSALHLATLLHPTPAVAGVPTPAALDLIAGLEEDRGPLTGAVGWVDADGNGEVAVTIRSGVLHGERLRLHAGAGIVAGSDPDAEVRETEAKLATMRRAVGL